MAQASVTFSLGAESVTSILDIDLDVVIPISGSFAGTIAAGEHAHITSNVNLTGDLIVEGLLTGVDTFTLEGNGFQILTQHGGQINLAGVEKSAWVNWGDPVVGWQTGDSLVVAPTAVGKFFPTGATWQGSWAATTRPPISPNVTLPDGSVARPEVLNRSQTILLKNLRRVHFHDGAGVQTLKWLKVLDAGQTGILAQYPIHFHLNGETSRGSLLEGVVVQNGKNHAFVPHGSHGITLKDCVAYNTIDDAFWWDLPEIEPGHTRDEHTANNSNDTTYEHVLGMTQNGSDPADFTLTSFMLGAGHGNTVVDSAMCCVQGGVDAAGFHWPSKTNQNVGGNVWNFRRNVSHNNKNDGVFVWQNDFNPHVVEDFVAYRNGRVQIDHGAYGNRYTYRRVVLMGGSEGGFRLHANPANDSGILLEDFISDAPLLLAKHLAPVEAFVTVRRCQFSSVKYQETFGSGTIHEPSWIRYEDRGFTPAKFDLSGIVASSIIEITEGGVQTHRWAAGVWS